MQLFQRSDQLKSPVMKEIVTEIRNSKKAYEDELKVLKEESTKTSAKRVTKKKIFETAFKVEKSLKKKLIDTTPLVTNDKNTQQSSEDQNKTTGLKRAHTNNNNDIDNPTKNLKKKKIQTSLNAFFKK